MKIFLILAVCTLLVGRATFQAYRLVKYNKAVTTLKTDDDCVDEGEWQSHGYRLVSNADYKKKTTYLLTRQRDGVFIDEKKDIVKEEYYMTTPK